MNPSDIIVLLLLAAAIVAVIRRNLKKGVPCESGGACGGRCAGCRRAGRCAAAALAKRAGVSPRGG